MRALGGPLWLTVDVVERHLSTSLGSSSDDSAGDGGSDFLALLDVRNVALRDANGACKSGLRHAEKFADGFDVVHAPNTSAAIHKDQ